MTASWNGNEIEATIYYKKKPVMGILIKEDGRIEISGNEVFWEIWHEEIMQAISVW